MRIFYVEFNITCALRSSLEKVLFYLSDGEIVFATSDVQVGTLLQQEPHALLLLVLGRQVERGLTSVRISSINVWCQRFVAQENIENVV